MYVIERKWRRKERREGKTICMEQSLAQDRRKTRNR